MCNKLGRFTNYVKDKINSALCIHKHQHVKCLTAVCGCCSRSFARTFRRDGNVSAVLHASQWTWTFYRGKRHHANVCLGIWKGRRRHLKIIIPFKVSISHIWTCIFRSIAILFHSIGELADWRIGELAKWHVKTKWTFNASLISAMDS